LCGSLQNQIACGKRIGISRRAHCDVFFGPRSDAGDWLVSVRLGEFADRFRTGADDAAFLQGRLSQNIPRREKKMFAEGLAEAFCDPASQC
jgi:hypothetical protein